MTNWMRLAISGFVSAMLALLAYLFPFTILLYFFAPGFRLGDALPDSFVNALGGYLFPVFTSTIIWTFLFFGAWWLTAKSRNRSPR